MCSNNSKTARINSYNASFNISALGYGDAVLVKSGICFLDNDYNTLAFIQQINKLINILI